MDFEDVETAEHMEIDANSMRSEYIEELETFRETYRRECSKSGIDYVPIDTSMQFDKALLEYLTMRQSRF
jgi:hypothetical protein